MLYGRRACSLLIGYFFVPERRYSVSSNAPMLGILSRENIYVGSTACDTMKRSLAVLFALMLVLSGCLGGDDVIDNEEPVEPLLDTDGDGIPDVDDDDDDGDSWSDIDELNCDSDGLLASSMPADADGDGVCDVRDSDKDGDGWSNIDEEACGSDPVVASDVPADADDDGTCDAFDEDADGDSFADGVENQCGSDPLDATSIPADMDGDGTCDALDDDKDGDGVANDDDFAPEDPDKTEGKGGCTDATAFNYDETAEVDDASCFTLEDAKAAMQTAFDGVISSQSTGTIDDMVMETTMVMDMNNEKTSLTTAMLDQNGDVLHQATYIDDGSGFVEVQLFVTPEDGSSPITEHYKVNGAYYAMDLNGGGWSHCEYDGTDWYCTDITSWEDDEMVYNSDSETDTYHLYTCANGDTVLLSQVNDGTEDCADASDEPDLQSDGSMFMCDDGSTIDFYLANDGSADCADGSDEDNFITEYACANGNTVPYYYINDDYDDCGDGSDEPVYDMSAYETSNYTCEDGSEVPLSTVNDGTDDCADGTDENPSGEIQELFEFPCSGDIYDDDDELVSIGLVNDGKEDCPNGEDEVTYDTNGDENSTFTCYDYWNDEPLNTIALSSVNDGQVDCLFHDDELVDAADNWFGLEIDEEEEEYTFTGECQVDGEDTAWPWVFLNDGIEDCDGATDEDDGTGTMTYTCEDGTVISFALLNDGSDDCSEGEDEPDYVVDYTCENGETVEFEWVNDGDEDCEDGTDEPTYDLEELTDFECDDGTLIPFSHVNDGEDDCADGEDEPVVEETSVFTCASGDDILLSSVNDGADDCPGADDEPSYDPISGSEVSTYTCQYSGEAIALSLVNDQQYDCQDGTDEPYFDETSTFECVDGSDTIPLSYVNDGAVDCDDGSDEAEYEMPEDESVFYCADGSEITVSQFDDGAVDCDDGSDEPATFMCNDGSGEIPFDYVNDGHDDCNDGSDESVVEDLNEVDCFGSDGTVSASQFRDGENDCSTEWYDSWDEMEFEVMKDCEWESNTTGWMCPEEFLATDETYQMWMHTDENGLEMIALNSTLSDGTVMTAMFDASTHAFLMMEETSYDEDGEVEEHFVVTSSAYDPTLVDALMVDTSLDTHAPPYAVIFDGQPHPVDGEVFVCDDGEEVPFANANDGEEDCGDGSDEPTYGEEVYTCSDDGSEIQMSDVNDGYEDCGDGSDEPAYDSNGDETTFFTCFYSGETIVLSYVNDNWFDCEDETDEYDGYSYEISGFVCDDGGEIDLSLVNDGGYDCEDGSDELEVGEGHGYGMYTFASTGIADWTIGADDDTLEVVFAMCDTFGDAESMFSNAEYLLPSDCGDELARYTMDEIDNGDIAGLMLSYDDDGNPALFVDEDFELDGWNAVRLSTPAGDYADENPQVQLPAPGIGFALLAMLGAAMLAGRRNE